MGPDATKFVLEQTELITMAVSKDYVPKLAKMKIEDATTTKKMTGLANLVVFEADFGSDAHAEARALAAQAGLKIYTLDEVIAAGRKRVDRSEAEPLPTDHIAFSYTSGTTGDPKGVKLTHRMILSTVHAVNTRYGEDHAVTHRDSYISYLPLAHSFEQAMFGLALTFGIKCGFFGGDILKLTEDIGVLRPTLFPSVPRLYNRIYGKI